MKKEGVGSMEMTMVPQGFYELPIFAGLSHVEVDEIGRLAEPYRFQGGEKVFEENAPSNNLDILWEGSIAISKRDGDGDARPIAVVQAKSVVGELSLMMGGGRSATGVAVGDVAVYRISREDFNALLDNGSLAAYKVVHNLGKLMSARLRAVDAKLVELLNQQADQVDKDSELGDFRKKLFTDWGF